MRFCPREWGIVPHGVNTCPRCFLSLLPLGAPRAPEGCDITAVDRIGEVAGDRITAVSNGINLNHTRLRLVPPVHPYRHHCNDTAFLRGAFAAEVSPCSREASDIRLDTPHTHCPQFVGCLIAMAPGFLTYLNIKIFANHRVQVLSAGLAPDVPHLFKGGNDIGSVIPRTTATLLCCGVAHLQPPEPLDCSFSGQSRYFTDRQQEFALSALACLPILHLLLLKYVVFCRHVHMATQYPHFYLPERFRFLLFLSTTLFS